MKTMIPLMLAATGLALAQPPGDVVIEVDKKIRAVRAESIKLETVNFVHDMSMGPIVKNAPYSAEAVTETIQQLYDGNRIVHRESSKLYRDSQGRERREESSTMEAIFISDPVAGLSYTLNPEARTAQQRPFSAANVENKFVLAGGGRAIYRINTGAPGNGAHFQVFLGAGANVSEPKEESLGTRMIEGVQAEGTRSTTVIPAGEIGNERPIEVVDERWFSPDLHMTIMTRHADPRSGETIYKLTNIQRVEQVRSLFEVPTGYTINEMGGGRGVIRK